MKKLKDALIDRIVARQVDASELNRFKSDFFHHLETSGGTINNYNKKGVIKAIMRNYPEIIGDEFDDGYTDAKVASLFNRYIDNVMSCRVVNPTVIEYIVNYMRGITDNKSLTSAPQVVIYAMAPEAKSGSHTLPESKGEIIDI